MTRRTREEIIQHIVKFYEDGGLAAVRENEEGGSRYICNYYIEDNQRCGVGCQLSVETARGISETPKPGGVLWLFGQTEGAPTPPNHVHSTLTAYKQEILDLIPIGCTRTEGVDFQSRIQAAHDEAAYAYPYPDDHALFVQDFKRRLARTFEGRFGTDRYSHLCEEEVCQEPAQQ